jgi:hypothetical protein
MRISGQPGEVLGTVQIWTAAGSAPPGLCRKGMQALVVSLTSYQIEWMKCQRFGYKGAKKGDQSERRNGCYRNTLPGFRIRFGSKARLISC